MKPAPRDSAALIVLLAALAALTPLAVDMYLPSLPALGVALRAGSSEVQLTLSIFLAGYAVSQLAYGPLSDRFGRRRILLGGLLLYVAASLACALAPGIRFLIVARFFEAVGGCAGPVLGRAMVRDLHGRERAARMLAYMAAVTGLAPLLSPILGGYLETWFGWRSNFYALTIFGVVLALVVWRHLDETLTEPDPQALKTRRLLGNYAALARNRTYAGYTLTCCFGFTALFCFISGAPFVLIEHFRLSPEHFGYFFAFCAAGYITGTSLAGRLTTRFGIDRLLRFSTPLVALAGAAMAALTILGVDRLSAILVPMVIFEIAFGITMPQSLAGAISPFPRMAGVASAALGFLQLSLAALVSALVAGVGQGTALSMTMAIGTMAILVFAAYGLLIWRRPAGPESRSAVTGRG